MTTDGAKAILRCDAHAVLKTTAALAELDRSYAGRPPIPAGINDRDRPEPGLATAGLDCLVAPVGNQSRRIDSAAAEVNAKVSAQRAPLTDDVGEP